MSARLRTFLLLGLFVAGAVASARAHLLNMTRINVVVTDTREVQVQVDVDLSLVLGDLPAYRELLQQPPALQRPRLEEIGRRVLTEIGLKIDGETVAFTPKSWTLPDAPPEKIGDLTTAAITVLRYTETLPPTARELVVSPSSLAKIEFPLAYTFVVPASQLNVTRWIELPGATSRVLKFPEAAPKAIAPEAPTAPHAIAAGPAAPPAPGAAPKAHAEEFTDFELKVARFVSTVLMYLRLGFHHILPQGMDHVLFVLGLFFLAPQWRPLLRQTTVFTIAHTTTLGLSAYGVISLPVRVVEPLIAVSIAYVAVENIWKPKLSTARLVIVFMFGLLHGLGFASSLSEVPMPRDQFFTALLSFNLGVDFGQLAVIATAFFLVGWFRHRDWYWKGIVVPACSVITVIATYWTATRIFV